MQTRHTLPFLIIMVFALAACTQPVPQTTVTPSLTATVLPTSTATPAPMELKEIKLQFSKVLTDPWNATDTEKAAYDKELIRWWREILKTTGVENADALTDYALLDAIITYQHNQQIGENETIEEQQSHLVFLPFSLHELIRTDMDNVVAIHRVQFGEGRYAKYGIGGTTNIPQEELQGEISGYPDFSVYGKNVLVAAHHYGINGDLVLLYATPGFDPSIGIGAVIRMYDGERVAYAEVFIPTSDALIGPTDICCVTAYMEPIRPKPCPNNAKRPQGYIHIENDWTPFELSIMLDIMSDKLDLQVEIVPAGKAHAGEPMWSDGITIVNNIQILSNN